MALVVQLRVADIANVLHKVLTDAEGQSFYILIRPELLHHLTAPLKALVVVKIAVLDVLPVYRALQVVEQPSIALPLCVRPHRAHPLAHLQAVIFQLDYLDAPL